MIYRKNLPTWERRARLVSGLALARSKMIYRKNLPTWERRARLVSGLALAAGALAWLGTTPLALALAASGACAALSGIFGFCPACALVGRRPVDDRGP